ncbi:protein rep [Desmospora activa]|uniref:Plasmid rolling circle replication initiator protein Rep n=1 Tax=Desmospora activa DSM 45169 TaxID=1121389 RepID=A0A2T4YY77_9BACL|nr:protein rep [Desmospora activa]PTM51510.1 plasmid rolling circle replication initiator protein Rep [Desmospora activa DSM 45169]
MPNNSIPESAPTLQDRTKQGKERPWRKHKQESINLEESYTRLGIENKAERVAQCGCRLVFRECQSGHGKKLVAGYFCQVRLCPMCAWRRSMLVFKQTNDILHEATKERKLRFLFLTLTCRNVHSEELAETLDKLFKAWGKLSRRKAFKDSVVGWFRALEVTHKMHSDEYHPHFHAILAVSPSYFKKKEKYITQDEWVKLWQKSLGVDYTPIVDIRTAKPKRKGQGMESTVAEAAKYTVKPGDFLDPSDEMGTDLAVDTLDSALHSRRLVAYGGLFKEIRKRLKQTDAEKADLVKIDEDGAPEGCTCEICGAIMQEVAYKWHVGLKNYIAE